MTKEQVLQALKAVHAQKGLPAIAKDLNIGYNNILAHVKEVRPMSNISFQMYRLYFENKQLYIMVQKLLLEEQKDSYNRGYNDGAMAAANAILN